MQHRRVRGRRDAQRRLELIRRHGAVVIAVKQIKNLADHLKVRVTSVSRHRTVSSLLLLALARVDHHFATRKQPHLEYTEIALIEWYSVSDKRGPHDATARGIEIQCVE